MAQNITLLGASYSAVPAVELPKTGGGTATFTDTSDATATADKILTGFSAYVNGTKIDGTATGGSGSGAVWQDAQGYVHLSDEGDIELQTKTVSPTESAQTVLADAGYYALDRVNVNAIPSNYVGSGITRRDSTDLSASGATVSVPSGYYENNASKAVASGTAGTPTATKGTVSSNSVSVTPSVTNTAGYISGGTKTGTAVTVTAAELVSGTKSITASGNTDVTNYATASVAAGSATPAASISATGATVSTGTNTLTLSKTVSNTPQVSAGYVSSGTAGNSSVSLTASINTRSSSDLTVSGATVTVPSGYYGSSASKSVASGTEGTPTASKGTVSNHQVSVTPSVTNTTGYITGSTKTGTAVTVTASELASGNKEITQNGTGIDVVGYSTVTVNVSGGGGSTNIVSGDFTAGTAGTVQTINIPYTGTGYIVSLMISVDGGLRGDYFYNVTHQGACGMYCGSKYYATQAPDYTANNANYNGLTAVATTKGSSGTTYSTNGVGSSGSTVRYTTADPSASSATSIVSITSKNVIKVFISASDSGQGFLSGAKYNYVVVYSE